MFQLQDFGSYTVGGRKIGISGRPIRNISVTRSNTVRSDPNGTYAIESVYVQYFVPVHRNTAAPVVLLHGGGMTGATWETTPDGRPGWLHLLLQRGYEVHVVDSVERGRAGWCAIDGIWEGEPVQRTLEEAWTLFRFGASDDFPDRTAYRGQQFPTEAMDAFARTFVPRWTSTTDAAITAFAALLKHLGKATIVCHSQGAQIAYEAAAQTGTKHVASLVALEPSGFAEEPARLRGVPTTIIFGDFLDGDPLWESIAAQAENWSLNLRNAGGIATVTHLPPLGIGGNSHMLMMDRNNESVLDLIVSGGILDS